MGSIIDRINGEIKESVNRIEARNPKYRPFPVSALPKKLQTMISNYHTKHGFNPEFQAGSALATFAGIIGNKFKIRVNSTWAESAMLWIPIVGSSSSMKTPAMSPYTDPVWKREIRWAQAYASAKAQYELLSDEDKKKADKPHQRHLILNDTTIEGIRPIHSSNPNGQFMCIDELKSWIGSMNQYRKNGGSDETKWLSIYSNKDMKVSRAHAESVTLEKMCITVLGGIQPSVMKSLAGSDKDGFTYRFSFILPASTDLVDFNINDSNESGIYDNEYLEAINRMFDLTAKTDVIFIPPGERRRPNWSELTLEPDAKKVLYDWLNMNNSKVRAIRDESPEKESIYMKSRGLCARLALVRQIMAYAFGESESIYKVSVDSVRDAIEMTEYFRETSIRAHALMSDRVPENVLQASRMYMKGIKQKEIAGALGISASRISQMKKDFPDHFPPKV